MTLTITHKKKTEKKLIPNFRWKKNNTKDKTKGDFAVSSRSYETPPEIFYDLIKHNKSPDSKAQVLEICRVKILCVITIPPFFPLSFLILFDLSKSSAHAMRYFAEMTLNPGQRGDWVSWGHGA